jgi:hypothetical protein
MFCNLAFPSVSSQVTSERAVARVAVLGAAGWSRPAISWLRDASCGVLVVDAAGERHLWLVFIDETPGNLH